MAVTPEKTNDEIFNLLRDGHEVDWRHLLTVMANMNHNLLQNSELTRDVAEKLELNNQEVRQRLDAQDKDAKALRDKLNSHENTEMELFNKTIGGYKVFSRTVSIVAFVVMGMGGYILNTHLNNMLKEVGRNDTQEARLQSLETQKAVDQQTLTRLLGDLIDLTHRLDDHERNDARLQNGVTLRPAPQGKR